VSEYTILRAADAPDFTGDAPGAFIGARFGVEQIRRAAFPFDREHLD
jgi:hypothetical protein